MDGHGAVSSSNRGRRDAVAVALGEQRYIHSCGGRKPEGKDQSEDIGVHMRVILNCM